MADVQTQDKESAIVCGSVLDAQDSGQRGRSAAGGFVPATWGGAVYPRSDREAVNGRGA